MIAGCKTISFTAVILTTFLFSSACSTINKSGYFNRLEQDSSVSKLAKEAGVSELRLVEFNPQLSEILEEGAEIEKGSLVYIPKSTRQGLLDKFDMPSLSLFSSTEKFSGDFDWPLERVKITSPFGRRGFRRKMHEGLDLKAQKGTPILSAAAGKVIFSGRLNGYGKTVILAHKGGYRTVYAHNSSNHVKKGQRVEKGEKIALVGNTGRSSGSHLHFEIRKGEKPLNPKKFLSKK